MVASTEADVPPIANDKAVPTEPVAEPTKMPVPITVELVPAKPTVLTTQVNSRYHGTLVNETGTVAAALGPIVIFDPMVPLCPNLGVIINVPVVLVE